MAVRDDRGNRCAIILLGWQRYWGVRAVASVGQWVGHCQGRHAESIILSAGGAESMMLSTCAENVILSDQPTEGMILSGHPESIILSVPSLKS